MATPLAGKPFTYRPQGLWDAIDGEQAPPSVSFNLQNLIHDITTRGVWQPRPSVKLVTTFPGFSTPSVISAMLNVGTRVYGLLATARNIGQDEPFCFETATNTFVTVQNVTATNTPTTQATTGAWMPPTMDTVGGRILVTHPGFTGSNKFGWFDISSFSSASITGSTNSKTTVNSLSSNVIAAGWQIGMSITGTDIPAGTFITAIASGGLSITISQAATGTTATQTYTVTGGTPAAPVWNVGDMNLNALPSVPTFVKQFNNRAYFACSNQLRYSDSLNPTNASAATQFLTCGDSGSPITGIGALAVEQTQGGILAAIMAFKAAYGYWQVTGDAANTNLTLNGPIGGVGCSSPRAILQTPDGLSFAAEDGVRVIDFTGTISRAPMIGVRSPFAQALVPSRICAAYNNTVMRFSMQTVPNPLVGSTAYCDYWYDYEIDAWGGPHTFSYDCAVPMGTGFILACNQLPGALYSSATEPAAVDAFVEQGQQMIFINQSCLFPQDESMLMKQVTQSTVNLQFGSLTTPITAMIISSTMGIAGTATLNPTVRTLWGQFLWAQANWNGATYGLNSYNIDWTAPVVYKEAGFLLTGACAMGLKVGPARFRTVELGYTNDQVPA